VIRLAALGVCATMLFAAQGCTPAQQATWSKVESTVLTDVEAGKSLTQLETDVATVVVGKSGAELVIIIDDALTFLEDAGAISLAAKPHAAALHAEIHPK